MTGPGSSVGSIEIVWIDSIGFGDGDSSALLRLRHRVLREPLGLDYSEADLESESGDRILVAKTGEIVVGGLLAREVSSAVWKIRQVVVEPGHQGRGIGRALMNAAARAAKEAGIRELVLHSRENVCGFYAGLTYVCEGEPFLEVGIPHRRMRLIL